MKLIIVNCGIINSYSGGGGDCFWIFKNFSGWGGPSPGGQGFFLFHWATNLFYFFILVFLFVGGGGGGSLFVDCQKFAGPAGPSSEGNWGFLHYNARQFSNFVNGSCKR